MLYYYYYYYYYYYWKRPALALGTGTAFTWRNIVKWLYRECKVNQSINHQIYKVDRRDQINAFWVMIQYPEMLSSVAKRRSVNMFGLEGLIACCCGTH